jgi:hypothetical protein
VKDVAPGRGTARSGTAVQYDFNKATASDTEEDRPAGARRDRVILGLLLQSVVAPLVIS